MTPSSCPLEETDNDCPQASPVTRGFPPCTPSASACSGLVLSYTWAQNLGFETELWMTAQISFFPFQPPGYPQWLGKMDRHFMNLKVQSGTIQLLVRWAPFQNNLIPCRKTLFSAAIVSLHISWCCPFWLTYSVSTSSCSFLPTAVNNVLKWNFYGATRGSSRISQSLSSDRRISFWLNFWNSEY